MRKARKVSKVAVVVAVSLCLWLPASESQAKGAWEWTLIPYLWVSDIGMEVKIKDQPVLGTDIAFGDLLDKVDYALTAHFEGRRGKGGFLFDLTAVGLSNDSTLTGNGGPPLPPGDTSIKTDVDLTLLEVGGFYRPQGEKTGLDLLFGIRYIGIDQKFDITLPDPLGLQTTVESAESHRWFCGIEVLRESWQEVGLCTAWRYRYRRHGAHPQRDRRFLLSDRKVRPVRLGSWLPVHGLGYRGDRGRGQDRDRYDDGGALCWVCVPVVIWNEV